MNSCHRRRKDNTISMPYNFRNQTIVFLCQWHSIITIFSVPVLRMTRPRSLNHMFITGNINPGFFGYFNQFLIYLILNNSKMVLIRVTYHLNNVLE